MLFRVCHLVSHHAIKAPRLLINRFGVLNRHEFVRHPRAVQNALIAIKIELERRYDNDYATFSLIEKKRCKADGSERFDLSLNHSRLSEVSHLILCQGFKSVQGIRELLNNAYQ